MDKLLNMRKKKGISQAELGIRIGVGANTISQYELGKRNPNPSILKKLAVALDCKVDELI